MAAMGYGVRGQQLPAPGHQRRHRTRIGRGALTPLHRPVVIRHRPGGGVGIGAKAGNQVQVEMGRPLAEGDRIHPLAARQLPHKGTGPLHRWPPGRGLGGREISRPAKVTHAVKQQPAGQRRGIGMVAQQPEATTTEFIGAGGANLPVEMADGTGFDHGWAGC